MGHHHAIVTTFVRSSIVSGRECVAYFSGDSLIYGKSVWIKTVYITVHLSLFLSILVIYFSCKRTFSNVSKLNQDHLMLKPSSKPSPSIFCCVKCFCTYTDYPPISELRIWSWVFLTLPWNLSKMLHLIVIFIQNTQFIATKIPKIKPNFYIT